MDENVKTDEEMRAELDALRAECERYMTEAKRYRNEARNAMVAARIAYGAMLTAGNKHKWITENVPAFAPPCRVEEVGNSGYLLYREHSNRAEFEAYADELEKIGYTLHDQTIMGKGIHAFYYNETALITLSFSEHDHVLRAVVEPMAETALVPKTMIKDGQAHVAPLLVQMGEHLYDTMDCGMSYIFRLVDGTFLLIDGGWDIPAIGQSLYEKLETLSEGRPIVISAWIFTHAHLDHMGAFWSMGRQYGDKVTVKRVIHNFPGDGRMTEMADTFVHSYLHDFDHACALYGGCEIIKARTGQQYHFVGVDIDMLFTYEDHMMPRPLTEFNATSLVFRLTTQGETFMFLGDASVSASDILVAKYGTELQSDIVQVAHHGFGGGTKEVYDAVKAPIVMWPICYDDPRNGNPRYSNPNFSPITREMIRNYATKVYVQCEGTYTHILPLKNENEVK